MDDYRRYFPRHSLSIVFVAVAILPLQSNVIEGGDLHICFIFIIIIIILTIRSRREQEERRKVRRKLILCNNVLIIFMFPINII